jgi:plastocyanin
VRASPIVPLLPLLWLLLAGAGPAPAREVRIDGFAYRPRTVTVTPGTRVRWVNRDIANHTVTFRRGPGDLGDIDRGRARGVRFTRPGRYHYVCVYHPAMHGAVVVR